VQPGEILGVLSPAGAGKTTLIRLLATLLPPSAGSFAIAGVPSSRPSEIRGLIGLSPAMVSHPSHLTGLELLTYYARLFGVDREEAPRLAGRLLTEVGLAAVAATRIATYDRELRRRLELARTLVNEPRVLLLDEPTGGLNPLAANRMLDLVRQVAGTRGASVVFATWEPAEVDYVHGSTLALNQGAHLIE
jgi:ABC-2 type transport system ATP-binding protein